MTDFDLERLGDVWRQQPDPTEMARLQRTAGAVARRARFAQVLDIVAAIVVAAVVLLLVLSNPRIEAVAIGAAAILLLLISNIRLRRLRSVELKSLTGTTENMLDQSIERVQATIKRTRLALIGVGPSLLIGGLVASSARVSRGGSFIPALHDILLLRIAWVGAAVAVVLGLVIFSVSGFRHARRELERLLAMREAYRQEHESTAP